MAILYVHVGLGWCFCPFLHNISRCLFKEVVYVVYKLWRSVVLESSLHVHIMLAFIVLYCITDILEPTMQSTCMLQWLIIRYGFSGWMVFVSLFRRRVSC